MDELMQTIMEHEGSDPFGYTDSLGYETVGIGRCIDRRCHHGLNQAEMLYLLNNDIEACKKLLFGMDAFTHQDEVRQGCLIELVFNMGIDHLYEFKKFLNAMTETDYPTACAELRDSLWAKQVGNHRVENICYRLLNGSYPPK